MVLGPTGTGKSETAVRVARRLGAEIVGCDAVQVYRGLDAATAKPPRRLREAVPHHLVDVADPRRDFTLADYVVHAERAIREIAARGRVALVVGGTGLYLRGLLRGLISSPAVDVALRARLRRLASRFGPERLHRWLAGLDPGSARRLPPRDTQRILRAIEIALAGGETWSQRLEREGRWARGQERFATLKVGLDLETAALDARLGERVAAFFSGGLVREVGALLQEGVPREANAFKAIGYREVLRALEEGRDPATTEEEVVRATRRYARRQRTWFRSEPGVRWLDASCGPELLADRILEMWGG